MIEIMGYSTGYRARCRDRDRKIKIRSRIVPRCQSLFAKKKQYTSSGLLVHEKFYCLSSCKLSLENVN